MFLLGRRLWESVPPKTSSDSSTFAPTTMLLLVHSKVLFGRLWIKQLPNLFQHCPWIKSSKANLYCLPILQNKLTLKLLLNNYSCISLSSLSTNYVVTIGSVLKSVPQDTQDLPTANTLSLIHGFTQIKWFTQIRRRRPVLAGPGEELSLSLGSQKSCAGSEGALWLQASIWGVPLLSLRYCC